MAWKSHLLLPVIMALGLLSAFAVFQIAAGAPAAPWLGVLLAAAPLPGLVTVLSVAKDAGRTSRRLPVHLALVGAGVALAVVTTPSGWGPPAAAVASAVAFLWYDFVYSDLNRTPSTVLRVGAPLPRYRLTDLDGAAVDSQTFQGRRTLQLFYRGNWCPLCMAQINEVAARYRALEALGVDVIMVSPQPHDQTAALARKVDAPLRFLVDKDGEAARALEIHAPDGTPTGLSLMGYAKDTVLPTVIATDVDGAVVYLDQTDNYRVRPEPDVFLRIFAGRSSAASAKAGAALTAEAA